MRADQPPPTLRAPTDTTGKQQQQVQVAHAVLQKVAAEPAQVQAAAAVAHYHSDAAALQAVEALRQSVRAADGWRSYRKLSLAKQPRNYAYAPGRCHANLARLRPNR